jgi:peptide/nickel transport system ATP-binding protein
MRRERGTTVVMITHDLGLLANIADHVMVLYGGRRMELGPSAPLFAAPAHPYTAGLLASSPANYEAGAELVPIPGRPPSLLETPAGCVFAPRCASAMPRCSTDAPPLRLFSDGLQSLCWLEQPPREAEPLAAPALATRPASDVVVRASGVRLSYGLGGLFGRSNGIEVLKGIDLELHRGETLGLVGESGCGKSTFARVIAGLIPMTHGSVSLLGRDLASLDGRAWQAMRREVQMVFQNPFGALNPRRRVGAIIGDPFRIHGLAAGADRRREVRRLMELVGLNPEHYNRFPSEFSGGQRQRIGIARALALNPSLIIYDEPVSALDVSIQAQVLNLMRSLQRELNLTYLFISHDLAVVRHVCDRIAVMQAGQIVELADAETLYRDPQHPYTRTLLAASVHAPPRHPAPERTLVASQLAEVA